jgi:CubicO group peptidase (beta-lactamase class C family)
MDRDAYWPAHETASGAAWERATPDSAGLDAAALGRFVALAEATETPWPRDLRAHLDGGAFEPPPDNAVLAPIAPRSGPAGLVLCGGRIVAEWGDTARTDATFSVAKSYLSLLAGIAVGDGLIDDIDAPVGRLVHDGGFEGPHNGAITWRHLLQQTSEWEGTLFGKSDVIDRGRTLASGGHERKGWPRPLQTPGTYWEYNDVRVNRLSLALMRRFDRELPEVFAERIMRPIGASETWRWIGYDNADVRMEDGRMLRSVPGGSHWGGGVSIGARHQARVGLMVLRGGVWQGRALIGRDWLAKSFAPCPLNPSYGLMWWLNTNRLRLPSAPEASVMALGAGGNITWIDPTHDLVAVLRWTDTERLDATLGALLEAVR